MTTAFLLILSFLKAYWKPIAALGLVLGIVLMIYLKGRRDESTIWINAQNKAVQKVADAVHKIAVKGYERKIKIIHARESAPRDDRRDSCLLSTIGADQDSCLSTAHP